MEASLKALKLPNLSALLPGMEVPLMPHQVIGVDWMLKQEACQTRRGGILADEMGLVGSRCPVPNIFTDLCMRFKGENSPSVRTTPLYCCPISQMNSASQSCWQTVPQTMRDTKCLFSPRLLCSISRNSKSFRLETKLIIPQVAARNRTEDQLWTQVLCASRYVEP